MPLTSFRTACLGILLMTSPVVASEVEFLIGDRMPNEGGTWNPESSPLLRPFGVAFDSDGLMYIVELEGGRVFTFHKGELTQVSGDGSRSYQGDGQTWEHATYNGMHNCAVTKNGDLLIADTWNHCVRKIDAETRQASTMAGTGEAGYSGDGGPASEATFNYVMCITLTPDGQTLHVTDLKNRRVRAVNLADETVRTVAGNGMRGIPKNGQSAVDQPLVDPRAAAADQNGQLYVLERGGHALRVVREDGTIETVAGTGQSGHRDGPAATAQFGAPKHLCIGQNGQVFIADDQNAAIREYDPQSSTVRTVLGRGHGDKRIRLKNPHGVCWHDGWLYVVDTSHNRLLRMRL